MLDQNTDRMWYVIGAILIGAAILFGFNTFVPSAFASVGDMFGSVTTTVRDSMEVREDAEFTVFTTGNVDMSDYERTGEIVIHKVTNSDNVYLMVDDLGLKPNTTYVMSYTFQKLDGELNRVGGHTDIAYANNTFYLDGQQLKGTYRDREGWTDELSELINQGGEHEMVVRFTTPDQLVSDNQGYDQYDGRIYIQANRMDSVPATVRIRNIQLQEVIE